MLIQIDNDVVKEAQKFYDDTYGGKITKLMEYSLAIETIVKEYLSANKMFKDIEIHDEKIQRDIIDENYEYNIEIPEGIRKIL